MTTLYLDNVKIISVDLNNVKIPADLASCDFERKSE